MLFLVGLAVTAVLAWLALQEPTTTRIALAAVAVVVTFVLWSRYSSAAPATVVVKNGELDIRTRDSHHRFDLASGRTAYDVEGSPGSRGWKVLIHRTGMPAYVVNASMVDPQEFTEVLDSYRPKGSAG